MTSKRQSSDLFPDLTNIWSDCIKKWDSSQFSETTFSFLFEFMHHPLTIGIPDQYGFGSATDKEILCERAGVFLGKNVTLDPDHIGNDALPTDTYGGVGPGRIHDFALVQSSEFDISDEDDWLYGCALACSSDSYKNSIKNLNSVFDFLSSPEIKTNASCGLTVRVSNNRFADINPLSLILETNDGLWMKSVNNKYGLSGYEKWVLPHAREALLFKAVQNLDLLLSSSDRLILLESMSHKIFSEKKTYSTLWNQDSGYVDFLHMTGKDYPQDSLAVTEIIEQMGTSCVNSIRENIDSSRLKSHVSTLMNDAHELNTARKNISLRIRSSSSLLIKDILYDKEPIGTVTHFDSDSKSNLLITIGPVSEFVRNAKGLETKIALLLSRAGIN